MRKWKHSITIQGKLLRHAVESGGEDIESCKVTLQALKNCYDQIKRLVKDDWWNFISDYESVEYYIDVLNNPNASEQEHALLEGDFTGCNPALDCINECLRSFYDLCDYYSIWVGV